jgi:hypothetical protein
MTTFNFVFLPSKETVLRWYVERFGEPHPQFYLKAIKSDYSNNWHIIKYLKSQRFWRSKKEYHWVIFDCQGKILYESPTS